MVPARAAFEHAGLARAHIVLGETRGSGQASRVNLEALRTRAAEIVASGEAPVCLRYRSAYDWSLGGLEDLQARFAAEYAKTDALAAELTSRGVAVAGVLFERKPFVDWLNGRGDSRELRLAWARERAETPGPHVWRFTLGNPPASEPAHPETREAFGEGAGWAASTQALQ